MDLLRYASEMSYGKNSLVENMLYSTNVAAPAPLLVTVEFESKLPFLYDI